MIVTTVDRVHLMSGILRSSSSLWKWFSDCIAWYPGISEVGYFLGVQELS